MGVGLSMPSRTTRGNGSEDRATLFVRVDGTQPQCEKWTGSGPEETGVRVVDE